MCLLTDTELRQAIQSSPAKLIDGVDPASITSEVYGCSVYLHIGDIFAPGARAGAVGSADKPVKQQHSLAEGQTAVVRTAETFKLDSEHAAIVLPSSTVSMQGLLMTNPGHVDPGYSGQLHVTVINMGSKPYALIPKARFLRALIFKLDAKVTSPLTVPASSKSPIDDELLERLSPDFLNIDGRAKSAAKKEIDAAVRANAWAQYGLPAAAAIVGAIGTGIFTYFSQSRSFEDQIAALQKVNAEIRLTDLENRIPTAQRLQALELEIARLKSAQQK